MSEGCRNCYAEKVAYRFSGPGQPYEGLVQVKNDKEGSAERLPLWNGQIKFVEEHLLDPLRWKKPRRIFVNSTSDLFHENVTDEMRDRIFAVMALCPQHTFQVLTKRPERMLEYFIKCGAWHRIQLASEVISRKLKLPIDYSRHRRGDYLDHVWLGVSVEDQKTADERIPLLLQTPVSVRFISAEPLLGLIDLEAVPPMNAETLDWVIVGGESGPGARPMHPDWARSLRDQCAAAGVPFFFKQWGEWVKYDWRQNYSGMKESKGFQILNLAGGRGFHGERVHVMQRVGKKAAGHLLDGVEHHTFPAVAR